MRALWPDYEQFPHIVNDKHFERLRGLLAGEHDLLGGAPDPATRFLPPSLLDEAGWDSPVMAEEIFGPILPVLGYTGLEEELARLREKPKPLALYLFTREKVVERRVLATVPFGGGCVNDTIIHLATSRMPFGGVGESGMGGYHGRASFDTFTHEKSIVAKGRLDLPLRYPPYTEQKLRWVRRFLG